MIRTDRKTGEPILSPKLTADQLHAMANDPGWRPWMRLIAVSASQVPAPFHTDLAEGARVSERWIPVQRVGLYVTPLSQP